MITLMKRKSAFLFVVLLLLVGFSEGVALGDLDLAKLTALDDSVLVQSSRVGYDRRTGQFSTTVTTTNISAEAIPAPTYLVIESISSVAVTVANADGLTNDGKPYFLLLSSGELASGGSIPVRIAFANPQRVRFNFVARAYAEPPIEITLDQGLSIMDIEEGSSRFIAFAITLTGTAGHTYNVIFDQTISPDIGGLSLGSDYTGGWTTSIDTTWTVNEFITGLVPGTYTVTTTVTIVETGDSASSQLTVNVLETLEGIPVLWQPGAEPDGIEPDKPTNLTFTVLLTGVSSPSTIQLEQVDENGNPTGFIGDLADDGQNGDLVANDGIYSGTFEVTASTEEKLYYRTAVSYGGYDVISKENSLLVTDFPIGPEPSDPCSLVEDPDTGESLYLNELVIAFVEGTSQDRIEEIVSAEGGTIIGTIPSLGLYQVGILGDGTSNGVYVAVQAYESYSEVRYAEPSFAAELDEFTPNDTKFSSQTNMTVIRADEAWVVAKGSSSVTIAVIDTGVNYDHEDLTGKVIKGKNYADDNDDPMDTHGHGTHVSGIAAAKSNNGKGVAGVSWDSKILAIRWTDGSNGGDTTLAASIRYAADNGAKIINISGGTSNTQKLRDAIEYADDAGLLICASAGNGGTNTKRYPGSYDECFCVGNTTDSDQRAPTSRYGVWVDISAPGVDVTSTWLGDTSYNTIGGTSMSTPLVAGAAAVVWSMHPSWTAAQVRERLEKTAKPLASTLQIGVGRIDLFEAVFNGSFEIGDLSEWSPTGTCSSLEKLGVFVPQHRERMGYVSTGPAGAEVEATLSKTFTIQSGVTSLPLKFEYNFVTEEYPEWVGTIYNDALRITLTAPDGTETLLAFEEINSSAFSMYTGSPAIDFPGGDNTVGYTGWKTASATVPVTQGSGEYTIHITDAGDWIYDSVVLIDNIRLK